MNLSAEQKELITKALEYYTDVHQTLVDAGKYSLSGSSARCEKIVEESTALLSLFVEEKAKKEALRVKSETKAKLQAEKAAQKESARQLKLKQTIKKRLANIQVRKSLSVSL